VHCYTPLYVQYAEYANQYAQYVQYVSPVIYTTATTLAVCTILTGSPHSGSKFNAARLTPTRSQSQMKMMRLTPDDPIASDVLIFIA
jgi:hypothetical protein